MRDGKPFYHTVQAAEKVPVTYTLTVTNRGGHSSVPRPDNAIFQLAEGLTRLARFAFPVRLNEVSRAFFAGTASVETPKMAAAIRAIVRNPRDTAAARLLSTDPRYNAMLRTTCTATRLAGGHAYNALPQTATANVNCRLLPKQSRAAVMATLVRVLADTGIHVTETIAGADTAQASPSPLLPELLEPVTRVTHDMFGAGVPVIPVMSTGATDGRFLRAAGIPTYGVSGLFGDPSDIRAHGRDERMRVKSFYDGQEFLRRLVNELAGGNAVP